MPSCVMRFCTNYSKKANASQGITYHAFPSNEVRCTQWVDIVRLQRSEEGWQHKSYSRICSVHFEDEDKYISAKGSTLLKKSALPSRGLSDQDAQQLGQLLDRRTPLDSGRREEDPLGVIEQCRFCGEFSKDCVAVSSDMTYLAGNKTTLALNDTSVQLDFNDRSLPKTVCRDCDAKLQEFCDFVNVVKAAQGTLINVAEEKEEFGTGAELDETTAECEENAEDQSEIQIFKTEYDSQQDGDDDKGIVDSLNVGGTVFVREIHKRKSDTDTTKPKKFKTKEKCDDDDHLAIDIKEEVVATQKRNSDTDTATPRRLKAKENYDDYLVIHIKQEVVEQDANDGHGQSEVSDTGTDVKPSELELATSALAFEMARDGTIEYQGYRSDR